MKYISFILVALTSAAYSQPPKSAKIDEAVTRQVLDHHFERFRANDLDGIMKDYAEQAILITPNGTYKGLTEIRNNFERVFKAIPTNGTTMTTTKTVVARDIAYILWTATTPTLNFKFASDTFIIVDGKIISQTFAGEVAPIEGAAAPVR